MKHVSSLFLLLIWLLILSTTSYGKSQESESIHPKSQPLEILYFEELPEIGFQKLAAQSTNTSTQTSPATWSFEAFGKSFEVFLHPNTRLVSKIPQHRRAQLEQDLSFYRGKLERIPESWVRLTRVGQQWSGMIWDGHEAYIIDALSVITPALRTVPAPTSSEHSIYRLSDTRDLGNRTCGMGDSGGMPAHPMSSFGALMEELEGRVGVTALGASRNIDMAVVTDQAFNNSNSNPNAAVIARMNVVDGIFSEQLGVQISLVDVLPLQSNGGLTSTNAGTLLRQFSQFSKSGSFVHPGVAHLFTGLNLDGSTVGIAYFRSICSAEFGVGIDQITGTGAAGALTVAHELGHNFGAPHDNENGSPCASTPGTFLMNPFLNGRDQFSPCSMSQIQPVVDRASCVTFINNDQADLEPRFQSGVQEAPVGQLFSSILSVTNNGLASALNARAVVSIPNGLSLENVRTTSGSCNGIGTNQATCTFDTIPPGMSRDITLSLNGTSTGAFTLLANVVVDNDLDTSNNTTHGRITITNAPPPTPPPGSTTAFTAAHSSKCLEIAGSSQTAGAKAVQSSCDEGANQQFQLTTVGTNTYQLKASHSGQCLEVVGASSTPGTPLQQNTCTTSNHQRFRIEGSPSTLVAIHSEQCIDVAGGSTSNGARLVQWTCHGGRNQQWIGASSAPVPPSPPPPPPSVPGPESATAFTAGHSHKCLEIAGNSQSSGARAVQSSCDQGSNQQFQLTTVGTNTYQLKASHSDQCLEVAGASSTPGTPLQQNTCTTGDHQRFRMTGSPSTLVALHSGQCVDVAGGSTSNGARLVQWTCHGGRNQLWTRTTGSTVPPPPPPGPGPGSTTAFTAAHSNKCFEIAGSSQTAGAKAVQSSCDEGANQKFQLTTVGTNTYQLKASHSGQCLEVAGASSTPGTPLQQNSCSTGDHQRFRMTGSPSTLVAMHSGQCIDVAGGSTSNGARLVQWTCHGGSNQLWTAAR